MPADPPIKPRPTPIASAVLPDGTLIEMIHAGVGEETALIDCRKEALAQHASLDLPGLGPAIPYSPRNNLLAHGVVLFPSTATEYESQADLLADVRAFIHRYADLSPGFEEAAAYYVLLSWVYDAFNEVPYLRLKGDYGSGKSRCLQVIGSLCYKPMFVSGASTVSPMFRIIDAFRGTLVLDESDFRFSDEKAEIVKILNNGNAKGFPVLRSEINASKEVNPRAFAVFGPKIIATRRDFEDRALESRCITESMSGLPPRKDIPLSLPETFAEEARELRNQLLMFRFRNLFKYQGREAIRTEGVEARVAQVFAPLLAVCEDPEAKARLSALARSQNAGLTADRSASVEAQLLETVAGMRRDGVPLIVRDIASRLAIEHSADYERPITPRWVGTQLRRRLSLAPVKSHGNFLIPETDLPRIDALCERYQLGDIRVDMGTSGTS